MNASDRLLDLLTARATEGLAAEKARELDRLLAAQEQWAGDELDLAAALVDRTLAAPADEPMPDSLRRSIVEEATRHVGRAATPSNVVSIEKPREGRRSGATTKWLGWLAAAAMLIVAVVSVTNRQDPEMPLTPEARRAALLDTAPDAIRVDWATPEIAEYAAVAGDVTWSDERQEGYMRLRGLPANRPDQVQYQLWIVDPDRDTHPVDGGVFDIPDGVNEVIVPIRSALPVDAPAAFAITLEKPGGVVVSAGPLLVVASV